MELRDNRLPVELRQHGEDGPKELIGTASVFFDPSDPDRTQYRLWDGAVERIMPTAFDRALAEGDDVRAKLNHRDLLGRRSSGTLTLSKDQRGLSYRIEKANTRVWEDLLEMTSRGDIDGSSFAFLPDAQGEVWTRDDDGLEIREIHSVRLYDVGPVDEPAYTGTSAAVRSEAAVEARNSWEAWQKGKHLEYRLRREQERERELLLQTIESNR